MGWLLRRKVRAVPLIVEAGRVFCPVRQETVPLEQCMTCPRLSRTTEDHRGSMVEIACRSAPRSFPGS